MKYECENCTEFNGTDDIFGLYLISKVGQRISPGELMPAGECPECGALIEVPDADIPDHVLIDCINVARKRGLLLTEVVEKGVGP